MAQTTAIKIQKGPKPPIASAVDKKVDAINVAVMRFIIEATDMAFARIDTEKTSEGTSLS